MKTYPFVGLFLACGFSGVFALQDDFNKLMNDLIRQDTTSGRPVVAVLPFGCELRDEPAGAGRTVAEYAVAYLANQPKYTLVERMAFQKIASELALSQSGIVDEKKAIETGKMLSAQIIITGNIGEILGNRIISASMTETETGAVIATSSITLGADKLKEFYKDALGERTQISGTLFRSLLAPGWGQFYTNHPVQGAVFSAAAVGAVGTLIWSAFDFSAKSGDLDAVVPFPGEDFTLEYPARRQKFVDARDNAYDRTITITGITIGVWVINIIDAAILGKNEKRRVKDLYFSANSYAPGIAIAVAF